MWEEEAFQGGGDGPPTMSVLLTGGRKRPDDNGPVGELCAALW